MTSEHDPHKRRKDGANASDAGVNPDDAPAWTSGLKQLYDSVVDEPLPDAFKDLLAQFDTADDGPDTKSGSDSGKSA